MALALRWTIAATLMSFGVALSAQSSTTFKARLSALPADARTRVDMAGSGSANAVLTGDKLALTGSFDGLRSAATSASLHLSVAAGVKGPAIANLTISKGNAGMISGSVDLTPQQLAGLRSGGMYIQIHSEKVPDGVLWGWLLNRAAK